MSIVNKEIRWFTFEKFEEEVFTQFIDRFKSEITEAFSQVMAVPFNFRFRKLQNSLGEISKYENEVLDIFNKYKSMVNVNEVTN